MRNGGGEGDASRLHLSLRESQEASRPSPPAGPAISNVEHTSPIHPPAWRDVNWPPSLPSPLIKRDLFVKPASRPIALATVALIAIAILVFQPCKQANRPRDGGGFKRICSY